MKIKNPLPLWIVRSPAFTQLKPGPRYVLTIIADLAEPEPDGGLILRGLSGWRIALACNCTEKSYWRYMARFEQAGFARRVRVGRGSGNPSIVRIPATDPAARQTTDSLTTPTT